MLLQAARLVGVVLLCGSLAFQKASSAVIKCYFNGTGWFPSDLTPGDIAKLLYSTSFSHSL